MFPGKEDLFDWWGKVFNPPTSISCLHFTIWEMRERKIELATADTVSRWKSRNTIALLMVGVRGPWQTHGGCLPPFPHLTGLANHVSLSVLQWKHHPRKGQGDHSTLILWTNEELKPSLDYHWTLRHVTNGMPLMPRGIGEEATFSTPGRSDSFKKANI